MSKLFYIYGCMGSSKTLRLLATAYNFEEKNIPFICLKPSKDTRDGVNVIKSRAGLERECRTINEDDNVFQIVETFNKICMADFSTGLRWILIDECQFLTVDQVNQLSDIVDILNVNVMCYGLRTDFTTEAFPAAKRLFEIADSIEEVKTSCECGKTATVNARIDKNGMLATKGEQVQVGGNDMYKALCRRCWKKHINIQKKMINEDSSQKEKL